ncbi:MAG: hypothetical protein EOP56_02645 [Sphingobacteriales bacterium]|nr:MAG: hypothetical protein EOP56_02645 [Sphingobacteriales bacterium]
MKLTARQKIIAANISILVSLIAICIFFRGPIAQFLSIFFVRPVVSGFENTGPATIAMLAFLIAVVSWMWHSGTRLFNLAVASIAVLLHLTQRWNPFWSFYPFFGSSAIYIWDIVVFALVLPSLRQITKGEGNSIDADAHKGFIEEEPVRDESGDSFKRGAVAARVAEMILATKNKRSFAIGIVGPYGSGKTSFINLIRKGLPEADVELMEFNPWSTDKSENISRDFFDQLAHQLYYLSPNLSSLITTYSRKLSRLHSQGEQLMRQFYKFSSPEKKHDGTYHQINQLLERSDKKLVVIIDDVDRLYKEEIMEVLKLIRNTANFANIIYLVAYEHRFVQEAIKSMNAEVSDSFLDKIIQLEIPLPKREEHDLLHILEQGLQPVITAEHYISLQKDIIEHGFKLEFDLSFRRAFRNSRDVIKFMNGFKLIYGPMKDETLFPNLFILELLKFRFVEVYDLLYDERSEWLSLTPASSRHDQYYELIEIEQDGEKQLAIEQALGKYIKGQRVLIRSLLRNLFNDYSLQKKSKHSIIYPMYFERYFRFRIAAKDMSEHSFKSHWREGIQGMKKHIDQLTKDGLTKQLTDRIFQENPTNRQDFELQIQSLFYIGPKYVAEFGVISFDQSALINRLWDTALELSKKFYDGSSSAYKSFLEHLLKAAEPPFLFENEFLFDAKRTSRELPLSKTEMTAQQVEYFQGHVSRLGLTDDAMWILFGIRYYYEGDKWHFEPDIIPVAKETIVQHDPIHFLRYSIHFDIRDKRRVMVEPQILEFFDNANALRDFVANHTLVDARVKEDYLRFFDKWETAGENQLVDYVFLKELSRVNQNKGEDD